MTYIETQRLMDIYNSEYAKVADDLLANTENDSAEYHIRLLLLLTAEAVSVFTKLDTPENAEHFKEQLVDLVSHFKQFPYEDGWPTYITLVSFGVFLGAEPELIARLIPTSVENILEGMDEELKDTYFNNRARGIARLNDAYTSRFGVIVRKMSDISTSALIEEHESETVELKSTFRFCLAKKKRNDPEVKHSVVKTIAAFMNTKGGNLIIGVNDSSEPVDLSVEFSDGHFDPDKFGRQLMQEFSSSLDPWNSSLIDISYQNFKGKTVCRVCVGESKQYVFAKKNGEDLFYIRRATETVALGAKEMTAHIQGHPKYFGKPHLTLVK